MIKGLKLTKSKKHTNIFMLEMQAEVNDGNTVYQTSFIKKDGKMGMSEEFIDLLRKIKTGVIETLDDSNKYKMTDSEIDGVSSIVPSVGYECGEPYNIKIKEFVYFDENGKAFKVDFE